MIEQPKKPATKALSSISACEIQIAAWKAYAIDIKKWAEHQAKAAEVVKNEAERQRDALMSGLTEEEIEMAKNTVYLKPPGRWVEGSYPSRTPNDWEHIPLNDTQKDQVEEAIRQIAGGGASNSYHDIRFVYLGTKSYARWACQDIASKYGCGPRHGSVTMEVGLTRQHRGGDSNDDLCLPPDVADASIKALRLIMEGKAPLDLLKA